MQIVKTLQHIPKNRPCPKILPERLLKQDSLYIAIIPIKYFFSLFILDFSHPRIGTELDSYLYAFVQVGQKFVSFPDRHHKRSLFEIFGFNKDNYLLFHLISEG